MGTGCPLRQLLPAGRPQCQFDHPIGDVPDGLHSHSCGRERTVRTDVAGCERSRDRVPARLIAERRVRHHRVLVYLVIGQPGQDLVHHLAEHRPCQVRSGAAVATDPEGQVPLRVAVQQYRLGFGEDLRVVVGRHPGQEHPLTGPHRAATDLGVGDRVLAIDWDGAKTRRNSSVAFSSRSGCEISRCRSEGCLASQTSVDPVSDVVVSTPPATSR